MTQVGSEEVRTSRWTRQRSSRTTGGTSGSTSMSLKLCDSFMKSWYDYKSGRVNGSFSFNSRRTMRMRPSKNYPQKLRTQMQKSFKLDTNASQASLTLQLLLQFQVQRSMAYFALCLFISYFPITGVGLCHTCHDFGSKSLPYLFPCQMKKEDFHLA